MSPRRTLRLALVVAFTGGAVACGLGSSGLMGAGDGGTSSPPGSTSSSGSSGAGSTGDDTLDATAGGSSSGGGSSGSSSGGSSGSTGKVPPQGDDSGTPPSGDDDDDDTGDDASIADAGLPDVHVLDPDAVAPDSGPVCDLDEDGFLAVGTCGGTDCCDYDSRAHPGETDYFTGEDACGTFDYNCNGTSELQFGVSNCTLSGFSCGADGFDGDAAPPCGASATYDTCKYQVFSCSSDQSTRVQACR